MHGSVSHSVVRTRSDRSSPRRESGSCTRTPESLSVVHVCIRALMLVTLWTLAQRAIAAEQFPYVAFVRSEKALVRSGPGKNYYATGQLRRGDMVEVFRHDPGGWCAIKPPPGSFSWIPAASVQIGSDGLALVTRDDVQCRVGSQLGEAQGVVQVHLQEGEVVEVLGIVQASEAGEASWVKISPPSGEFRWIHQDALGPSSAGGSAPSTVSKPAAGDPPPVVQADDSPRSTTVSPPAAQSAVPPIAELADQPNPNTGKPGTTAAAEQQRVAESAEPLDLAEFQAEINSVNLDLSLELTKPALQWDLASLQRRIERLVDRAPQPSESQRARELLERIVQAQEVRKRYEAIGTVYADSGASDSPQPQKPVSPQVAKQSAAADAVPPASSNSSAERFDGTGRLVRVLPPKLGAPRYALLDAKGNIAVYVTPAPDLNLQYYLGRWVGINGIRGYVAEKRTEHVTAKNVTLLDGPPMR